MSRPEVPEKVVAAITAAIAVMLDTPADRLRVRLRASPPADDDRGAWGIAARLDQMRRHRP